MAQLSEQEISQLQQNEEHLKGMHINYSSPVDRYGTQIAVLTDPSDDLYNFELFLRCLKQSENGELIKIGKPKFENGKPILITTQKDGQKFIEQEIEWKPLMNDVGINSIMLSMHSILNTKTPLSNLDDKEIFILIFDLGKDIITNLTFNSENYECGDMNRSVIVGAAVRFCYIFLKRPYGEGDRKFFKGTSQEVTHKNEITKSSGGISLNPFSYFKKQ